jgi:hypothetical protein
MARRETHNEPAPLTHAELEAFLLWLYTETMQKQHVEHWRESTRQPDSNTKRKRSTF